MAEFVDEIDRLLSLGVSLGDPSGKLDISRVMHRFGKNDEYESRRRETRQKPRFRVLPKSEFHQVISLVLAEMRSEAGNEDQAAVPAGKSSRESNEPVDIARLLSAAKGRDAPLEREVRWVACNILRTWRKIVSDDVPSEYSVGLLSFAKRDESEFRKLYDAKVFSARSDRRQERAFEDDKRTMAVLSRQIEELTVPA